MTNPIQRAGNHLHRKIVIEGADSDVFALAQLVFESIDIDDLADVLHGDQCPEDPDPDDYCNCDGSHYTRLAQAVKAHLTGGEQ